MSGGLKPGGHLLIALGIGAVASLGLYFLPKTLPNRELKAKVQSAVSKSTNHTSLTPEQKEKLQVIRKSNGSEKEELQALSEYFAFQNIFDSSAYFLTLLAEREPSEEIWLKTGDLYYQAYSLSLDPVNREELGEIARKTYQKVLEINPHQLQVTNRMLYKKKKCQNNLNI
jgi:predicted RNA binding protein with dsRBD fold (UPF0201 family)